MRQDDSNIASLQRQLENVEGNDEETHWLYNNLGIAYTKAKQFRRALSAHRLEKRACRRRSNLKPGDGSLLVDLAIAYRRCGDAMLRVDGLSLSGTVVKERRAVIRLAHAQHVKGLEIAREADPGLPKARVEVQEACAAVAHSALELGQETRARADLERACVYIAKAASLSARLGNADLVSTKKKRTHFLSAAINFGIALSALADRPGARAMLESAAVRAKAWGDATSYARAVANLAVEAELANDWEKCEQYNRLWLAYGKDIGDESEQSEALRKLGVAVFQQHRVEEARDIFQQALLLATDENVKKDVRKSLLHAEKELEELAAASEGLAAAEKNIPGLMASNNFMEEAKVRVLAGALAFQIRKESEAIAHLLRYFELVDNFSCDPEFTGVSKQTHCFAVANLAEAFWKTGKLSEAIHWGTRELTTYGDDVAGQAQAWCNLGVYLSDDHQTAEALDAWKKSIELADEAGQAQIRKNAEDNIDILLTESQNPSNAPEVVPPPVSTRQTENFSGVKKARTDSAEALLGSAAPKLPRLAAALNASAINSRSTSEARTASHRMPPRRPRSPIQRQTIDDRMVIDLTGDDNVPSDTRSRGNSIVIMSGTVEGGPGPNCPPQRRRLRDTLGTSSAAYSYSKPLARDSTGISTMSRGVSGADRSSGARKYVDVASVYRKLCGSDKRRPLAARAGLLEVLRAASNSVLANADIESGSECVVVDLQGCFLSDRELGLLFHALASFGKFKPIALSVAQNPLLSAVAYRCFAGPADPNACANIRVLDLGCAGVDAAALQAIAAATRDGHALAGVRELRLGRNGLGRTPSASADVCATLVTAPSALRAVDLSLNLLSTAFFRRFVDAVQLRVRTGGDAAGDSGSVRRGVTVLDFKINNRRNPSAMLEFDQPKHAVQCVAQLLKALPSLQNVDLRSCGAPFQVRKALHAFARDPDVTGRVTVVTSGVFDEAAS